MSADSEIKRLAVPLFIAFGKYPAFASFVAVSVYVILLVVGCYFVLQHDKLADPIPIWLKGIYGLWTIVVPLFFFSEYLANAETRANESPEDRKERLDDLKHTQGLARDVWLACATVVGLLLFKA